MGPQRGQKCTPGLLGHSCLPPGRGKVGSRDTPGPACRSQGCFYISPAQTTVLGLRSRVCQCGCLQTCHQAVTLATSPTDRTEGSSGAGSPCLGFLRPLSAATGSPRPPPAQPASAGRPPCSCSPHALPLLVLTAVASTHSPETGACSHPDPTSPFPTHPRQSLCPASFSS